MDPLNVALAQRTPAWLDRAGTLAIVRESLAEAALGQAGLVVFPEAFVPGYPFWVDRTDGARFHSPLQRDLYAHYVSQAVDPEAGDLAEVEADARDRGMWVVLGCIERAADRGGHSLYASLVVIGPDGRRWPAHRKLVPTYEERLVWAPGDGHGLRVHRVGPFTMGALNCWENWMPLTRAALYGLGEDLHVAAWPGSRRNTERLTPVLAEEGRSYVLSVSSFQPAGAVPAHTPHRDAVLADGAEAVWADGGSCIAAPDGSWVVPPVVGREALITACLDVTEVHRQRQLFDPVGHYSRPDVTRLIVDRARQRTVAFDD